MFDRPFTMVQIRYVDREAIARRDPGSKAAETPVARQGALNSIRMTSNTSEVE
jgi:hypothetical protein